MKGYLEIIGKKITQLCGLEFDEQMMRNVLHSAICFPLCYGSASIWIFLFTSLELLGQLCPRLIPERLRTLIPVLFSCSEGLRHTFLSPFLAL